MTLGIVALVCLAVAVGLLVRLHTLPTGLTPVGDAVSDYGTTRFHWHYRAMAVALGAGAILLALALHRRTNAGNLGWLWAYGASRIAIAAFMTDRDPQRITTEGRVHWLLAAIAFTSIAFAGANVHWSGDPSVLRPLGYAVAATAAATLLARMVPPLRPAFGLVERALYATSLAWLLIAALNVASS